MGAGIVGRTAEHPAAIACLVHKFVFQHKVLRVDAPTLTTKVAGLQSCSLRVRCVLGRVVSIASHDTMSEVLDTAKLDLAMASAIRLESGLDATKGSMHALDLGLNDLDKLLEHRWADVGARVGSLGVIRHDVMWSRCELIMKYDR
jgi:hypothetical protein